MKTWYETEGAPHPLGVSYTEEDDVNFALYAKTASKVRLLLYKNNEWVNPYLIIQLNPLVNESQRVWHCRLKQSTIGEATFYAYQVEGPLGDDPFFWHRYDPQKIILDP